MNTRHTRLRGRSGRQSKKARCSCGWESPWRTTPPTGRRRHDAQARYALVREDFQRHLEEVTDD